MLKFINNNLSIGDYVELETPDGNISGSILEILPDCLVLSENGIQHRYIEEKLLGVRCVSGDFDVYKDSYIQKFFPFEKNERSFYAANYHNTLSCSNYGSVIQLFWNENMSQLKGHVDLPDMIDVENEYYNVESFDGDYSELFSEYITSIKLPKYLKRVGSWSFKDAFNLQRVFVPNTLVDTGAYKIGGCPKCQVLDLNGIPLDWEFEPDW